MASVYRYTIDTIKKIFPQKIYQDWRHRTKSSDSKSNVIFYIKLITETV